MSSLASGCAPLAVQNDLFGEDAVIAPTQGSRRRRQNILFDKLLQVAEAQYAATREHTAATREHTAATREHTAAVLSLRDEIRATAQLKNGFLPRGRRRRRLVSNCLGVSSAPQAFLADADNPGLQQIGQFLTKALRADPAGILPASEVYDCYAGWCLALDRSPISQTKFGNDLSRRGIRPAKRGIMYRVGITWNLDGINWDWRAAITPGRDRWG